MSDHATSSTADGYRPGYEIAAERILELIGDVGLQPGDRMPTELELAARLGLSRSVVREAVKILSALGRVRAQKGRGLYVADDDGLLGSTFSPMFLPIKLEHIDRLFEFRRIQEVAAAQWASQRATPVLLQAISHASSQCRLAVDNDDLGVFAGADDAFHLAIARAADNPFLEVAIATSRRAQGQSARLGLPLAIMPSYRDAVEDHEQILQAVRDGDADLAGAAAGAHIDHTYAVYRSEIERRITAT